MNFTHICRACGHRFVSDIVNRRCSLCLSDDVQISSQDQGRADLSQMIHGGNGSHWDDCWRVHWDCYIKKVEAELAAAKGDDHDNQ